MPEHVLELAFEGGTVVLPLSQVVRPDRLFERLGEQFAGADGAAGPLDAVRMQG